MFCPACQQDVPALAVPEEPGVVRCAFCGEELEVRGQESGEWSQESVGSAPGTDLEEMPNFEPVSVLPPRPDLEDWDLEPQLRATERLLKGLRQTAPAESVMATHTAHAQAPAWHVPAASAEPPRARQEVVVPKRAEKSSSLAWACLSLGVMALACGLVLIGWSLADSRDDLWSLGLPLAVVGQGGLVIGLLLQLNGLWQSSQRTDETLTLLDGKLHDLAHTTTMLGTTRSTPAQSFYVHMAEGASPHLLLADLKGQLDLLAERLARK
ncbi:MAG: hypothetical protein ACR2FY_23535 [Pirellulaceae bacterium]